MKYAFNGLLFTQRQTGVMRFAREILQELDQICQPDEFVLVVPEYIKQAPEFKNIKVVKYGSVKGNWWEQLSFPKYLRKNKLKGFNFNNTSPIFSPCSTVIHDIAYKLHPEFGTSLHGKLSRIYHKIIYRRLAKSKERIFTVTYFSKFQLIDVYKIKPDRIKVIGNAWQHINRIQYDDSVLTKNHLTTGSYYFTLGSMSIMKNTKWVLKVAEKNPDCLFVLAGAKSRGTSGDFKELKNVIYLGFVSDEQVKSLLKNCKAFIYPSIYDGFGIPPLEALSQGATVICSSAACLPEVYKNSVHYIDPYCADVDIESLLNEKIDSAESVLNRYSWKKSAKELYECLK